MATGVGGCSAVSASVGRASGAVTQCDVYAAAPPLRLDTGPVVGAESANSRTVPSPRPICLSVLGGTPRRTHFTHKRITCLSRRTLRHYYIRSVPIVAGRGTHCCEILQWFSGPVKKDTAHGAYTLWDPLWSFPTKMGDKVSTGPLALFFLVLHALASNLPCDQVAFIERVALHLAQILQDRAEATGVTSEPRTVSIEDSRPSASDRGRWVSLQDRLIHPPTVVSTSSKHPIIRLVFPAVCFMLIV